MRSKNFDVFNGDADGICALLQLHLSKPEMADNQLISGIKRDINLLKKIPQDVEPSHITVLDISLDKNHIQLQQLLDKGFSFFYADHHFQGEFPDHPKLQRHIDTQANTCTSLIINHYLKQQHYLWAIVGAFGDNMNSNAMQLCQDNQLSEIQQEQLKKLGIYINYNAYGASVEDLHYPPEQLFAILANYANPLDFINTSDSEFNHLEQGYIEDMAHARKTQCETENENIAVFILQDAAWARRVNGVWGNDLANQFPDRAHAVITIKDKENYAISVRAPLNNRVGADDLCRQFTSGGGRKAAAGINYLPKNQLDEFIKLFNKQYAKI